LFKNVGHAQQLLERINEAAAAIRKTKIEIHKRKSDAQWSNAKGHGLEPKEVISKS
jgi:hypothetical protein